MKSMKLTRPFRRHDPRSPGRAPRREVLQVGPYPFGHSQQEELRELARLRDEGIVTEEEFRQKERQFLGL